MIHSLRRQLGGIQSILNYNHWEDYPQFSTQQGLGRAALTATILGILWGIHFAGWMYLFTMHGYNYYYNHGTTSSTTSTFASLTAWQWCTYGCSLCTFHLLEFFTTALYNPTVTTANSFLINHSTAYTAAALSSWMEFGLVRCIVFWIYPKLVMFMTKTTTTTNTAMTEENNNNNDNNNNNNNTTEFPRLQSLYWNFFFIGWILVVLAQTLRSSAMRTAGQSFNHYIQTRKRNDHVLITHGVYHYIRHPSYTGFFLWCIGSQLLLGNVLHTILYTGAAWTFFYKRIAYEEESLCALFPDEYPVYVSKTYSGIPFIWTNVEFNTTTRTTPTTTTRNEENKHQRRNTNNNNDTDKSTEQQSLLDTDSDKSK